MKFKDIPIGSTFDFVNDQRIGWNSFFERCQKVTHSKYLAPAGRPTSKLYSVGSIHAEVYHVTLPEAKE